MRVQLHVAHPQYYALACDTCEQYLHTDGHLDKDTSLRGYGKLRPRPKGVVTPCWKCPKIPAEAPRKAREYAIEGDERTDATIRHYFECVAVGEFPDDPIVRRNAAIIRGIIDRIETSKRDQYQQLLLNLFSTFQLKGTDDHTRG